MKANLEYRILSLEFRGMKPRAMFNGATIVHDRSGRSAQILNFRTPWPTVKKYLAEIDGREVRTIRYQIIAKDPATGRRLHTPVAFCHPFPRGTRVHLTTAGGGLKLIRLGDKKFFSDDFWLTERLNDDALPRQSVYQFHE